MELNLFFFLAPTLQCTSIDRYVLFMRAKKKKKFYFIRYQWLKNIKMPLSLSLSLTHTLRALQPTSPPASTSLTQVNPSPKMPIYVSDPHLHPLLFYRSDPRRHCPPQAVSHHYRPSLYSLCYDWVFFLIFFNVFSYKFGGYGGCGDG